MFGYLAQPIDQARRAGTKLSRLVAAAQSLALDSQVDLFMPGKAYHLGWDLTLPTSSAIEVINRQALDLADAMFVALPAGVPTLGVPVEVERALNRGLPVVIVTERKLADNSVQVHAWQLGGALVLTLDLLDEAPHEAASACRDLLRNRPRVATERPATVLPYVRADPAAGVPVKAYPDDAGLDLAACESTVIPARGSALVRTGLRFALPPGMWGLIVGRSSTWAKRGLDVKLGVIDAGWRGELFVSCYNPTDVDAKVEVGERLAQYILLPAWQGQLMQVSDLPAHARGENGFGSSGL